jgi:Na+/melibiose symporter-like transporter
MKNKTKGDIKATVIMLIYMGAGAIGYMLYIFIYAVSYWFEQSQPNKDIHGYVIGFVLGIMVMLGLNVTWLLIRGMVDDIDDINNEK